MGDAEDGSDSVQCHTDLTTCCSMAQGNTRHRPDWYFPDGDGVGFLSGGGDIYQARGAQRNDLRRRNNALTPSGIYHCEIPTDAVNDANDVFVRETVYVGIYGSGGMRVGALLLYIDSCHFLLGVFSITCTTVASPQFTLTCISTGGPATTVTWTRDSVTVTEGTETVLDDPVTAQYTHTLTVTGNQSPALFNCTVANSYSAINTQISITEG